MATNEIMDTQKSGGENMLDLEEVQDYADKVAAALRQSNLIEPEEENLYAQFIRQPAKCIDII